MKLTYIYHSGFGIEDEKFTLIMDYYRDSSEDSRQGIVHRQLLHRPVPLYVLVSHVHADHFNPEIWEWRKIRPDIRYICSGDILRSGMADTEDAVFLEKGKEYKDHLLKIKAYGSTDAGISFLIGGGGKKIFHAGDLNNWHWNEESTEEESRGYERDFLHELDALAHDVRKLDLAMFPVDPRLGRDYMRGAEQFVERIKIKTFAPMHFGERYDKADAFREYAESRGARFIGWMHRGETIEF